EKEVKKGGIIIPDTAKEKPQEAKVIAAGNGKVSEDGKKIPLDVKTGDKILFGKYSGSEVKIDDKEYLIMREEDVLSILEQGGTRAMPKQLRLDAEARASLLNVINLIANSVKATLGVQGCHGNSDKNFE